MPVGAANIKRPFCNAACWRVESEPAVRIAALFGLYIEEVFEPRIMSA